MTQWAGHGNRISLDNLCTALGLPGKGEIDGSQVYDYWKAGRIAELIAYCADDVHKAREVHRRMTFQLAA
ncbi:putative 3'-5' exonuclease related to the exonuclease domain of PolB [compost metagenome]